MFHSNMTVDSPSIRIRTDELRTVREAMRDFGALLSELEEGGVEKLVLTQRNRMRAVVVSVERWSEVERALASGDDASPGLAQTTGSVSCAQERGGLEEASQDEVQPRM